MNFVSNKRCQERKFFTLRGSSYFYNSTRSDVLFLMSFFHLYANFHHICELLLALSLDNNAVIAERERECFYKTNNNNFKKSLTTRPLICYESCCTIASREIRIPLLREGLFLTSLCSYSYIWRNNNIIITRCGVVRHAELKGTYHLPLVQFLPLPLFFLCCCLLFFFTAYSFCNRRRSQKVFHGVRRRY